MRAARHEKRRTVEMGIRTGLVSTEGAHHSTFPAIQQFYLTSRDEARNAMATLN